MNRSLDGIVVQTDAIRDYVLPIGTVRSDVLNSLAGTAFLIGPNGYAITAGHCVTSESKDLAALFLVNDAWEAVPIEAFERHPTEDLAILRLGHRSLKSIFAVSSASHYSSLQYRTWGYPEDTYHEVVVNGYAKMRPDLVYTAGYIRRRIEGIPVDSIRGTSFYEVSEIADPGSSGAPVLTMAATERWEVIGVYVGERRSPGHATVGYAVRSDSFAKWCPRLLDGRSVEQESLT